MKVNDMRTGALSLIFIVLLFAGINSTQTWALESDLELGKKW
ncbi:unnamed protein product, partial [marine sediment metagenome]